MIQALKYVFGFALPSIIVQKLQLVVSHLANLPTAALLHLLLATD